MKVIIDKNKIEDAYLLQVLIERKFDFNKEYNIEKKYPSGSVKIEFEESGIKWYANFNKCEYTVVDSCVAPIKIKIKLVKSKLENLTGLDQLGIDFDTEYIATSMDEYGAIKISVQDLKGNNNVFHFYKGEYIIMNNESIKKEIKVKIIKEKLVAALGPSLYQEMNPDEEYIVSEMSEDGSVLIKQQENDRFSKVFHLYKGEYMICEDTLNDNVKIRIIKENVLNAEGYEANGFDFKKEYIIPKKNIYKNGDLAFVTSNIYSESINWYLGKNDYAIVEEPLDEIIRIKIKRVYVANPKELEKRGLDFNLEYRVKKSDINNNVVISCTILDKWGTPVWFYLMPHEYTIVEDTINPSTHISNTPIDDPEFKVLDPSRNCIVVKIDKDKVLNAGEFISRGFDFTKEYIVSEIDNNGNIKVNGYDNKKEVISCLFCRGEYCIVPAKPMDKPPMSNFSISDKFLNYCKDKFGEEDQLDSLQEVCERLTDACSNIKKDELGVFDNLQQEIVNMFICSALVARQFGITNEDIELEVKKQAAHYGFTDV